MTTENPQQHMPEAPGQEPWTSAERLYREEALRMELAPPAGLEAQVFSALDQPVSVLPKKTSWWIGGMAVAAAVAVVMTWWAMPSDPGHVASPAPHIDAVSVPAAFEPEASKPSEAPLEVQELVAAPSAKVSNDREEPVQGEDRVSTLEALEASEVPAGDDLNTSRGLSVKDRSPQQEVRKAKVKVHSEH